LLEINNDGLIKVYGFLGELAEQMAVKETATPPATNGGSEPTKVFGTDGQLNAEQLSKMQDEILALPNTPNKQELKEAIFKKYGY
jgi:glycine betaine/choline ABC-type transport system substrate-binding protein